MKWNVPGDDWVTYAIDNDVKDGGAFLYKMKMKNDSLAFDFAGNYDKVSESTLLAYTLNDGRKTINTFTSNGNETIITETFDAESETPIDQQKAFCSAVLNGFKKYTEGAAD